MKFREATVLVLFVILVILWFFRSPGFFESYGDLIMVSDGHGKFRGLEHPRLMPDVLSSVVHYLFFKISLLLLWLYKVKKKGKYNYTDKFCNL